MWMEDKDKCSCCVALAMATNVLSIFPMCQQQTMLSYQASYIHLDGIFCCLIMVMYGAHKKVLKSYLIKMVSS